MHERKLLVMTVRLVKGTGAHVSLILLFVAVRRPTTGHGWYFRPGLVVLCQPLLHIEDARAA